MQVGIPEVSQGLFREAEILLQQHSIQRGVDQAHRQHPGVFVVPRPFAWRAKSLNVA